MSFWLKCVGLYLCLISGHALAEGRCPEGYFPIGGGDAGWEGCAPMGPSTETGDQEVLEPQWETRWGSIATTSGAMGVSAGMASKESAESQALADCEAKSGGNVCTVKLSYYNQCAALAWGDAGSLAASAYDRQRAETLALEGCKEGASNCELFYSGCSYSEPLR